MVNPGGTGSPALVISDTPAPLPPSSSRICALPSLKRYTHLLGDCLTASSNSDRVICCVTSSLQLTNNLYLLFGRVNSLPDIPKVRGCPQGATLNILSAPVTTMSFHVIRCFWPSLRCGARAGGSFRPVPR